MVGFIIAIIVFILGAIVSVFLFVDRKNTETAWWGAVLISTVVVSGLILVCSSVSRVPTGHTGVVTTFGKVENYTLDAGIHFVKPWQKTVKMDNRVQKQTENLSCFSSDIQEVSMVYTINYQIKKADAMTIYSTIGKDYYNTVIVPCITEAVKVVTARYTAEQLVGKRNELAAAIEVDLSDKLDAYNIELVSTSIENMDFTDAFTDAVEAKQVAQQNKLRAETEAEQKVIEAEAASNVRRVNADAAAYELLAEAEAKAEANRKISESLTDELIAYTYANTWDGKLPTYMAGDSETIPVLNLSNENDKR